MLGERIAFLRGKQGLSQAELARRLNISPSAVGMYEQGRREPPVDILISLAGNCLEDCRLSPGNTEKTMADFLKMLNREELLVLLTATLLTQGEK